MAKVQTGGWILEKLEDLKDEMVTDEEVDGWFLMGSPLPIFGILGFYLYFVLKLGPRLMENRKPFQLKEIMLAYNLFQVVQNTHIVWLMFATPGSMDYTANHLCAPLGRNNNPLFGTFVSGSWYFFISKVIDLLDTVFFVLRKKSSHVTFLHVYHHANMVLGTWAYLKYLKGEQLALVGVLNAFVHVVMYSYYFLAALGPSVQKYLWWKKYITKIQITQFLMILAFLGALMYNQCTVPMACGLYAGVNALTFLVLFLNFYFKTYNRKERVSVKQDKSE